MTAEMLVELLGADFYTGVPDSQLKALCDYLFDIYGTDPKHHIIAANEGNSTAIAAGYHLSTGKVPVVYMQNSGEGNIMNPVASLLNYNVYSIPMIFIIGWRGEPEVHDEPQHIYQGKITLKLLEDMDIRYFIIDNKTTEKDISDVINDLKVYLDSGKQAAFVVRKGALTYKKNNEYHNKNIMYREEIIRHILNYSENDPIISTTGKTSRELFELREKMHTGHRFDFLTVGSMGHSSSIALGAAISKPDKRFWCIDGDGSALMHMGALAVIGSAAPKNLIHIVINNGAHESVGGMTTAASDINLSEVAKACGYPYSVTVAASESLHKELFAAKSRNQLTFIEVKSAIGSRSDLGRPTTAPVQNKKNFMEYLGL